jgi:putative Holliday junction resolvase
MSGKAGTAAKAAAAEIEALQAAAGPDLPVVAHDERLTTVTAQRALAEAKVKKGNRRALVDQVAAAVMLQSWLDAHPGRG